MDIKGSGFCVYLSEPIAYLCRMGTVTGGSPPAKAMKAKYEEMLKNRAQRVPLVDEHQWIIL